MRLDQALVARGLVRSRSKAQALIAQGAVSVDGVVTTKASTPVDDGQTILAAIDHYVSRAAHKLLGALTSSGISVHGRALDAGASTGGFTQVLLERGCSPVYAVDVGHDQLDPTLRHDPRVVVHEGINVRDLNLDHVEGKPVDVLVADVSFISLTLVLDQLLSVTKSDGVALVLVKPQFEVGKSKLGKGGVVRDVALQRQAVADVEAEALRCGWRRHWCGESQITGQDGNAEYFLALTRSKS